MAQRTQAWLEEAIVTITEVGGTDYDYQTLTETVDIDQGDRDIEAITVLSGGRITKFTPEDVTTVTLECYALEAGTTSDNNKGFFGMFWDEQSLGSNSELQISATRSRTKYRMVILWTDQANTTTAPAQIVNSYALRWIGAEGYITSVKPSFTDGILKFTVTFKVPPYDEDGASNIKVESLAGSGTLSALSSYTSTTKF